VVRAVHEGFEVAERHGLTELDRRTTAKVHHELLENAVNAGRWAKIKLDVRDIADIRHVEDKARRYYRKMTRPFGDDESRLIPATLVPEYLKEIGKIQRQYEETRDQLAENWDMIVERQKLRLGNEFNPASYPPKEKLSKHFYFRSKMTPVPDWSDAHDKDHVIFKIEQAVAKDIIETAREDERRVLIESTAELWMRLMGTVDHIRDICITGKNVHERTIRGLEEDTRIVGHLNFTNDPELDAIVNEVKEKLCGWSPKQIRKSSELKKQLGRSAEVIVERIREKIQNGFIAMAV
jgi:hypothetical protein